MARYIDADIALEKMKNWHTKERLMDCVRDTPAVDVVKVKHGYWIEGKTLEKCSVCGKKGFPDWYYCPHCGAKMDGTPKERGEVL